MIWSASAVGTVVAGVIADLRVTYTAQICASVLLAAIVITGHVLALWYHVTFVVTFGVLVAFCSSTLSIFMCADLAAIRNNFGVTTAVIDGGATLIAAPLQLVARGNFEVLQVVATSVLACTAIMLRTMHCLARPRSV